MTLQLQWIMSTQWKEDMQQLCSVTAGGVCNPLCTQRGWQMFQWYMLLTLRKSREFQVRNLPACAPACTAFLQHLHAAMMPVPLLGHQHGAPANVMSTFMR